MFKRVLLALTFLTAFSFAGVGISETADAWGRWRGGPYVSYYAGPPRAYYYNSYYSPYRTYYRSYYGPGYYRPYYGGYYYGGPGYYYGPRSGVYVSVGF